MLQKNMLLHYVGVTNTINTRRSKMNFSIKVYHGLRKALLEGCRYLSDFWIYFIRVYSKV